MSDSAAATAAPALDSAAPAQPQAPQIDEVEIDLGEGVKYKQSELRERMARKSAWEQQSHQRYQEAAQMKKNLESALRMVKENPAEFLKQTGIDPEEFSKTYLQDKLKVLEMTPEQRELMEVRKQLEDAKRDKEKVESDRQKQSYQQEVQKFEQYFDQQFAQSMTQVGLPKNPLTIKRMAEKVELYMANDMPVDVMEIAREIKHDYAEEYGSMFQDWDDDFLGQAMKDKGRERARSIIMKDVKSPSKQTQTTERKKYTPPTFGKKVVGLEDLNKKFEKLKFGR